MNKTVYLAGGCFWGLQGYYDKIKGTISTEVGYANGPEEGPITYKEVCASSGHAEVIKLTFDSEIISVEEVFEMYIRVIEPHSKYRQGGDAGIQYRIGIYSEDTTLLSEFDKVNKEWETQNSKNEIDIEGLKNYYPAEESHQKYLEKNPNGYCHINLHDIPNAFKK